MKGVINMKRRLAWALALACLAALVSCSAPAEEGTAGTITFYSGPTHEELQPEIAAAVDLNRAQAKELQKALSAADNWVDDRMVNRMAYYFDGEFRFSDEDTVYYFTYEHNVVYYDHYFADVGAQAMEYIKELGNGLAPKGEKLREVVGIDTSALRDMELPDVEEPFYEDETYIYIFGNPISSYVVVEYSDGSTQSLKQALEEGNAVIADLDRFGIGFFAEPKQVEQIIDLTVRDGIPTDQALEPFYEDGEWVYSFPSIRSGYVMAYYKDGTEQTVKEALNEGKITLRDLDWFGISYYKREKTS